MTDEVMAEAGAAAENLTPDSQNPEVASPETSTTEHSQQTDATPENGDDADKSLKRLQRRVDRVTAARYQAEARAQQLEAELQRYRQPARTEEQPDAVTPDDIDRLATERAREIVKTETVIEQSRSIRSAAVKAAGGESKFEQALAVVMDEAGPLADPRTNHWTPLGEAISRKGPEAAAEMLVYLGKNPDVAASLHGLDRFDLAERMTEIRAEMRAKPAPLPKPLKPVTPSGVTAGRSAAQMTDDEWYASRRGRK